CVDIAPRRRQTGAALLPVFVSYMSSPVAPRLAAFAHKPFVHYWSARFCATFAVQIIAVAVGWQIYDLTRDPLDLGVLGLVQFLPLLLLVPVTGSVADRYGR